MRRSIFFLLWFLIETGFAWLLPHPLKAAPVSTPLLVKEDMTLPIQGTPYLFESIEVEKGATLHIDPGVVIQLAAGAEVEVKGAIEAVGTAAQPIIFESQTENAWQQFICEEGADRCDLQFLHFENFINPVSILTTHFQISDVELENGVQNQLLVGSPSFQSESLSLDALLFKNSYLNPDFQQIGLRIQGMITKTVLTNVTIQDIRPINEIPWQASGILVEGVFHEIDTENTILPNQCKVVPVDSIPGQYFHLIPDLKSCTEKMLPVIFVPGYATSMNLDVLTNLPNSSSPLQGWRFFKSLTPAYTTFLDDLTLNAIPYEVAYYDWRLPAAEAAQRYLEPIIAQAKQKYGVSAVNIVAHSFGGIVSRAYIQGDQFQNDVNQFIELGSPNLGLPAAYEIWEGAVLPDDWAAMYHLIRYYQYAAKDSSLSTLEAIHSFFPSVQDILPIYPALYRNKDVIYAKNPTLEELSESEFRLFERVKSLVIGSEDQPTLSSLALKEVDSKTLPYWPDGAPLSSAPGLTLDGDGTVPVASAFLPILSFQQVSGEHSTLPAVAAEKVITTLYPTIAYHSESEETQADLAIKDVLSFLFDCPVQVHITLPDGTTRNSSDSDPQPVGEVVSSSNLLWMLLPKEVGEYKIVVTALSSTHVRGWVEHGEIQEADLLENQSITWNYDNNTAVSPLSNTSVAIPPPESSQPVSLPVYSEPTATPTRSETVPVIPTTSVFLPNNVDYVQGVVRSYKGIIPFSQLSFRISKKYPTKILPSNFSASFSTAEWLPLRKKIFCCLLLGSAVLLLVRVSLYWKRNKLPP